jgi:hypothetical protein
MSIPPLLEVSISSAPTTRRAFVVELAGRSGQHGDCCSLGLEDGYVDITQVFTVGLERQRTVADDLDSVGVVHLHEVAVASPVAPTERVASDLGKIACSYPYRRD